MDVGKGEHSRGILDFGKALEKFSLQRFPPPREMAEWVEGFWQVSWDLPEGEEFIQSNIAHASVHIASEGDGSWLYGVPDRLFTRKIRGSGWVFGIKFNPGGFHPWGNGAVSALTGKRIRLEELWGKEILSWHRLMRVSRDGLARVRLSTDMLETRMPAFPARSTRIARILMEDSTILSVRQAASAASLDERTLQRLFRREVGIGPKEVLKRFRLQEAAERLAREPGLSAAELALELGYVDQAHFTRDFKSVAGRPPQEYRKKLEVVKPSPR